VIALQADGPATILERLDTPSFAWASWRDEKSFFWTRRVEDLQALELRAVEGGSSRIRIPCDTKGAGMAPIVSDDGNWLILLMYSPGVPGCRLFAAINSSAPDFVEIDGFDSEDLNLAGWQSDGLVLVPRNGGGREIALADLTPLLNGGLPVLRLLHRDDTGRLSSACALANGDVLLIDRADDGGNAFRHLSLDGKVEPVEAGAGLTWGDWTLDRNSGRLLANLTRWDTPSHLVAYDPAAREFTPLRQPAAGLQLWTGRDEAIAEDGTCIPVTLLKPKDMVNESDLPCLLWGYGGFGIGIRPHCMMGLEPWLAAGGMVAIAHGRGGGELGPAWHDAGKGINKLNSFTDFIAVARWLAASGHTSARRLCLRGASAGGLLVLGSAVMAPDCCAAVIAENPVTDMAKFTHYEDDGRYWTVEFGNPAADPDALAAIARWSPLHNLEQGRRYPATLITIARNDERVSPVHGRKMIAALQATGSAGPHLLLELDGAGHAGHATVTEDAESRATLLRFAAWATGLNWQVVGK
ncbi:MAG TPA: prolyl oligopeptidase family serine peptidase, partial [Candidatus Omnitrophota bacterium]|nr:prolyl oligopeptidase family serine peptidase [Candidatus Omnitrophota bacterium]